MGNINKKWAIIVLSILTVFVVQPYAHAKQIKVAVIDTGFDFASKWHNSKLSKPKLCKSGHKDFTGTSVMDNHSHGTHISSLIASGNDKINYCIVELKYFDKNPKVDTLSTVIKAISHAIALKVAIINLSISGLYHSKLECALLTRALDKGIKVIAAAGNNSLNIDRYKSYPAMCDKRIMVVMNGKNNKDLNATSNYSFGKNTYILDGKEVKGLGINDSEIVLSGTSQSAALLTSKVLRELKNY